MATEPLYADAVVANSGGSGTAFVIGAPNEIWSTNTGSTDWNATWSMGDPSAPLTPGATIQSVSAWVRREAAGGSTPQVRVEILADAGTVVADSGFSNVQSAVGESHSVAFFSNEVTDPTTVQIRLSVLAGGGSPSNRRNVQIDAITWTADITAAAPQGTASGAVTWTGAAAGARPSTGAVAGTTVWTASAAGTRTSAGTAVGGVVWTGSAAGTAPTGAAEGSATGTITWAGSAAGERPSQGQAAGGVSWAGSGSGQRASAGTASGMVAWTGSAVGARASEGAAVGGLAWTGSTTGSTPGVGTSEGSAAGTLAWAGSAAGSVAHAGAAVGSLILAGSASGTAPAQGEVTQASEAPERHAFSSKMGSAGGYLIPGFED